MLDCRVGKFVRTCTASVLSAKGNAMVQISRSPARPGEVKQPRKDLKAGTLAVALCLCSLTCLCGLCLWCNVAAWLVWLPHSLASHSPTLHLTSPPHHLGSTGDLQQREAHVCVCVGVGEWVCVPVCVCLCVCAPCAMWRVHAKKYSEQNGRETGFEPATVQS